LTDGPLTVTDAVVAVAVHP
jgi:hypothetical protein